jgi:hypothetical protein
MRFYDITITDPANPDNKQTYTSWFNGQNDPGALNVIFDFPVVPYSTTRGAAMVEISGIPLQSISFATNLNNKNVSISAGFKPGLPLATQASRYQEGPIVVGFILQAYGNWVGNNMTLNLVISPGQAASPAQPATTAAQQPASASATATAPLGSPQRPADFSFLMPVGMNLETAIKNTLSTALPTFAREIKIRNIIAPGPRSFVARSLSEFAQKIKQLSQQIEGEFYRGVEVVMQGGNTLLVYDGTIPTKQINIQFADLIGQPTWIEPFKIQFKCPLRADLQVGYNVKLPEGFYGIQPNAPSTPYPYRFQSAQQDTYNIIELRHVGNFRQPDGNSWATIVTCAFIPAS